MCLEGRVEGVVPRGKGRGGVPRGKGRGGCA